MITDDQIPSSSRRWSSQSLSIVDSRTISCRRRLSCASMSVLGKRNRLTPSFRWSDVLAGRIVDMDPRNVDDIGSDTPSIVL
jgi:hypothetical protein